MIDYDYSAENTFSARASILALFYYRQSFSEDLTDAVEQILINQNESASDAFERITKVFYAMVCASEFAEGKAPRGYHHRVKEASFIQFIKENAVSVAEMLGDFVRVYDTAKKESDNTGESNDESTANDMTIIASCKRIGLSFEEINELTLNGYMELVRAYNGDKKTEKTNVVKGTPEMANIFF